MGIKSMKFDDGGYILRTPHKCVTVKIYLTENNFTEINKARLLSEMMRLMCEYESSFPKV